MPLIRKPLAQPAAIIPPDAAGLSAADADTRWSAARSLGGDPESVAALSRALAIEPNARVREAIFSSLVRINTPQSFAAAVHALRHGDASRRSEALAAMSLMPELALANLDALLRDEDSDIRIQACELARPMTSAHAVQLLAGLLTRDPDENVCAAALEILTETGGTAELAAIENCGARFPAAPFLGFAAWVAAERIRARLAASAGE